ncbi:MAG: hypothetical protein J6L81_05140 [Clostridia bacterium]|nr:hypothetical protein [Clostridia bacterium]
MNNNGTNPNPNPNPNAKNIDKMSTAGKIVSIIILIVCSILLISPVDLLSWIPIDDIGYVFGIIKTGYDLFSKKNKSAPTQQQEYWDV